MICSSAIGFDPRIRGNRLTFGFEGIWQGTAVLYDHQTRSLWMHLTGECFQGTFKGLFLMPISSGRHTTWADWRKTHPGTEALAEEPWLLDPRGEHGYFTREGARSGHAYFPDTFPGTIEDEDERLARSALVYGVLVGRTARAYPFERLRAKPVIEERIGGVEATVWFDGTSRSAGAYDRKLQDRTLTFRRIGPGTFQDAQTKSRWSMEGTCTSGPLKGAQLERLRGTMSEWYGWYASYPETTLYE